MADVSYQINPAQVIGSGISAYMQHQAGQQAAHERELDRQYAAGQADINYLRNKEFAQSGIQWKVADALKAGIHPLYALGGSTPSFSPSSVSIGGGSSRAPYVAAMGQDISRAVAATAAPDTRLNATMQALAVNRAQLENDLLRSQISRVRQQTGPAIPDATDRYLVPGQGQTVKPQIKEKPFERSTVAPENPGQEPGAIPDVGYARAARPGGGLVPVPSKDVKERIEDNFVQELLHSLRNNILPYFGFGVAPPGVSSEKEARRWRMNWFGEYEKRPRSSGRARGATLTGD